MAETWKAIAGYEGLYEVSDLGRVRRLNFHRTGHPWILNPGKNGSNYLRVSLYKDGKRKKMLVHRLVAETFIPNPNHLATVNHKDENKHNNSAGNLEWMSVADNNNYGTRIRRAAEENWKPVQMFDKQGNLIATFSSAVEAKRVTGISRQGICMCCSGKRKSAGGHIWRKQK